MAEPVVKPCLTRTSRWLSLQGVLLYSLALSMKMNIILFAPALGVILLVECGLLKAIQLGLGAVAVQLVKTCTAAHSTETCSVDTVAYPQHKPAAEWWCCGGAGGGLAVSGRGADGLPR